MEHQQRIPLFPLGVVLLPRMPLPLHIFEERYKEMIGLCIETGRQFGVIHSNGSRLESAGCTATVERVVERYDDGRLDILTIGQERFRIDRTIDDKSYLEADVRYFTDCDTDGDHDVPDLARRAVDKLVQFARLAGRSVQREILDKMSASELSFVIGTAGAFFTLEEKQQLLEMTSPRERLEAIVRTLDRSIERKEMMYRAQKVIGSDDISRWLN